MAKKKQEINLIDCSLCKQSIIYKNKLHCKLRIKDKIPTQYSEVAKVPNCVFVKYKDNML